MQSSVEGLIRVLRPMVPAACSTVLPALKGRRGVRWGVGGGACYAAIRAGTPLMAPATTTAWRVGSAATPTDALRYCPARRCEGLAERRPASRLQARAHGPLRACLSTDSARAGTDLEVPRRTRRVADGMDVREPLLPAPAWLAGSGGHPSAGACATSPTRSATSSITARSGLVFAIMLGKSRAVPNGGSECVIRKRADHST